jgi:hypothetical protein
MCKGMKISVVVQQREQIILDRTIIKKAKCKGIIDFPIYGYSRKDTMNEPIEIEINLCSSCGFEFEEQCPNCGEQVFYERTLKKYY